MPVLVTAAERSLARRIAIRLLQEGGEVRVVADGDVAELRAAGAFVASGTGDDEGLLEAAAADVHTIVHVGGGLLSPDPDRLVRDAEVVATAATNAGVRRIVALSLPGAASDADDALRRAKGRVEARFEACDIPTVVVRASLVDTPAIRDALITAGVPAELDHVRVAPVRTSDLVEVVVAFDRARSSAPTGHLVVAADGPDRCSIPRWLAGHGAGVPGRGTLVGRRLTDDAVTQRLRDTLDGPWWTDDPLALDAWQFAGITPSGPPVAPGA